MIASQVVVSKETRAKNQLSKRQLGKLRYERLVELDKSGELSRAKTRNEVAQMLGYEKGNKTGISWVNNLVARGYMREIPTGSVGGSMEKEFHLTSKKPDYDFKNMKAVNQKLRAERKAKAVAIAQEIEQREKESNLVITKGDLNISTTLGADDIVRVITSVLSK